MVASNGSRWPLTGTGNVTLIGAVLAALLAIFGLINGVPWERRGAAAEVETRLRAEYQREITMALGQINERLRRLEDRLLRGGP